MRITADTNVLIRAIVADDPKQTKAAQAALAKAELVAITTATLCEFVWVLSRGYGVGSGEIAGAIRGLMASAKVEANRPAIDAGIALLERGDFADAVIAFEGAALGGEVFASFDKDAVALLKQHGQSATLLG